MGPFEEFAGRKNSPLLLIADHASAQVPEGVNLGIDPALMETHIALDIGVAPLVRSLCARLGCPAILGAVSRLVIDFNREEDAPNMVPLESDGHAIPGNAIGHEGIAARIEQYWRPYHDHIASRIASRRPAMLLSLHSFTPQLATKPDEARPWEIGILYNNDDRAARIAIPLLKAMGMIVGDQLPYSGKTLNATMNRHGETNGIPYLGIEMRQDLLADARGVARWTDILATVIAICRNSI